MPIFSWAKKEDLVCDELCIHVTGEKRTEGLRLKELRSASCVTGAPERTELSHIGINCPVFYSSAWEEHPGRNVTDGKANPCWYPETEGPGSWILVDLEGTKEI